MLYSQRHRRVLVSIALHGADIQDHDGALILLNSNTSTYPWLRHVFADGSYTGRNLTADWKHRPSDNRDRLAILYRQG